jgi:hypothetical protein
MVFAARRFLPSASVRTPLCLSFLQPACNSPPSSPCSPAAPHTHEGAWRCAIAPLSAPSSATAEVSLPAPASAAPSAPSLSLLLSFSSLPLSLSYQAFVSRVTVFGLILYPNPLCLSEATTTMLRRNRQRGCRSIFHLQSRFAISRQRAFPSSSFLHSLSSLLLASTVLPRLSLTLWVCVCFVLLFAFRQLFRLPRLPPTHQQQSLVVFVISCPPIVPVHAGRCSKNTAR